MSIKELDIEQLQNYERKFQDLLSEIQKKNNEDEGVPKTEEDIE